LARLTSLNGLTPKLPAVEIELEAYTPCMCGDFQTRHYEETSDGKLVYTGVPTAKALLGKMRWLARLAVLLATAQGDLRLDHKLAEERYPVITIKNDDKTVKLGLIPFAFGTTIETQWKGVVSVSLHTPNTHKVYGASNEIVDENTEALKKAGTRYALLTIGSDRTGLEPVDPHIVGRVTLRITFDEKRLKAAKINPACFKAFILALAQATPLLLGLGKGATRGFGRFKPTLKQAPALECSEYQEFKQALENLLGPRDTETAASAATSLLETLARLAAAAANETSAGSATRHLSVAAVEGSWAGILEELPASPMHAALAAIARATLKSEWKRLVYGYVKRPGSDLHTWPLGLPRSQKFPYSKRKCRGSGCGKMKTGYLFIDPSLGDHAVISKDEWTEIGAEEGRLQSPVILFPLPPGGGKVIVVAVALKTCDFEDLVGELVSGKRLYHAGPHRWQQCDCEEPVISVEYILSNEGKVRGKPLGIRYPDGKHGSLDRIDCETITREVVEHHAIKFIQRVLEELR